MSKIQLKLKNEQSTLIDVLSFHIVLNKLDNVTINYTQIKVLNIKLKNNEVLHNFIINNYNIKNVWYVLYCPFLINI